MCGIIGICTKNPIKGKALLSQLAKMEYRGYDSFGIYTGKTLYKHAGRIQESKEVPVMEESFTRAIGHTRWATHGLASTQNAHPHTTGKVTLVHNGIIENFEHIKKLLKKQNITYASQTDSEVIAWYIQTLLEEKKDMLEVLQILTQTITGTYAFAIMVAQDENIYFAKKDSPLLVGFGKEQNILTSDGVVFDSSIIQLIYIEDEEYGFINDEEYVVFKEGTKIEKEKKENHYIQEEAQVGEHKYFLHKEICESPQKVREILRSIAFEQKEDFLQAQKHIFSAKAVLFVACGTASYAAGLGASILREEGVHAKVCIASEFEESYLDAQTLVVAVSQSGETMDVIEILKCAKNKNAQILAITNTAFSTIERLADASLRILAGQEIAVASTKAFINQTVLLFALAKKDTKNIPKELEEALLLEPSIHQLAKTLVQKQTQSAFLLGRKNGFYIAQEVALKIKEVSYIHAEAMRAGEFKHGSLALIEEETPVFGFIYQEDERMRASLQEARTRGANILVFGTKQEDTISINAQTKESFSLCCAMLGQLLGYYLGVEKNLDVDRPRNLAKSVTVH